MLRVSVQHVLDAFYLADRHDPAAIGARLDAMTPQHARVWLISQDESHDKTTYFVDAPNQVSKLTPTQIALWKRLERSFVLALPAINTYIANDFSLIHPSPHPEHPETLIDDLGFGCTIMPSRAFADGPRSDITLSFRKVAAMSSAGNQVIYSLNDYLSNLELTKLSNEAYVGGIRFSSYATMVCLLRQAAIPMDWCR